MCLLVQGRIPRLQEGPVNTIRNVRPHLLYTIPIEESIVPLPKLREALHRVGHCVVELELCSGLVGLHLVNRTRL